MKTIPKIDRERLGQLLPGALLKLGSQIVTFDGYRDDVDYQQRPTRFVEYTGSDGCRRRFDEAIVLQSATEHLDAEMCAFCGKFRAPGDLQDVSIQMYRGSERHVFCSEGRCAESYQLTIKRPVTRHTRQNVRRSPFWK
ncbi:hypothetical protein [Serratia sp. Ag2]|uniref:hypothetical protein n=1 Tax=Serratia sp. Ag2 TaxID=1532556 RepID=UPI00068D14EE|nr:hypothetical protein [Serratia sp. Ag2]